MRYLLDTDTLIFLIRGLKIETPKRESQRKQHQSARKILRRCRKATDSGDELGISAITVAELEYGARLSADYKKEISGVRRILFPFTRFDFDALTCAAEYGRIRYELQQSGNPIGSLDTFIAAQSLALGATLVSNNARHFRRVKGLRVENWA